MRMVTERVCQVGNDEARVGYFRTSLKNEVQVELSASRHAGIIEYGFPKGEKNVLVDVSHVCFSIHSDRNIYVLTTDSISLGRRVIRTGSSMSVERSRCTTMGPRIVGLELILEGLIMVCWASIN